MKHKLQIIRIILLSFFPLFLFAQSEGAVSIGIANHEGDLHSFSDSSIGLFQEAQPTFGLYYKYKLNESLGIRANLNFVKLSGSDLNFEDQGHNRRGYSFSNNLAEASAMLQWELLGKKRYVDNLFKRTLSPYLLGGLGVAFSSPTVDYNGSTNTSAINVDNEASKTLLILPVGLGLRYDLSEQFGLALETVARLPISDYYDGVSQVANPNKNDIYQTLAATLIFSLNSKDKDKDGVADKFDKCPEVFGVPILGGCPDTDKDGIIDSEDTCPNEAGKKEAGGCPDTDNDGVVDKNDTCPDTPGLAAFSGCPDTDNDGITDKEDACPDEKGAKSNNGCPDTDGDGVVDKYDACPDEKGTVLDKGCPIKDTDKDGVPDKKDECPDEKGTLANNGCAFGDTDKDGLRDNVDKCPNEFGDVANSGCPKLKDTSVELLRQATKNVRFETNGNSLTSESKVILNEIAELMKSSSGELFIRGYTDSKGSESYNLNLSERRARACYGYLISKGVSSGKMSYKGHGEANPIASNDTKEGRFENRRVTFDIVFSDKK